LVLVHVKNCLNISASWSAVSALLLSPFWRAICAFLARYALNPLRMAASGEGSRSVEPVVSDMTSWWTCIGGAATTKLGFRLRQSAAVSGGNRYRHVRRANQALRQIDLTV
jgi:hypothetical protein